VKKLSAINLANVPVQDSDNGNSRQRGRYIKPSRDNAVAVIKRMIIEEGYSPEEVRDQLKIPDRSFERYMHVAFASEKQAYIKSVGTTDVLHRVSIAEARLSKDRRDLINLINDDNIDPKRLAAIVEGYKLASSLNMAILKLHDELLPRLFTERRQMDFTNLIYITLENGRRMTLQQYFDSMPDEDLSEEALQERERKRQQQKQRRTDNLPDDVRKRLL
jgi:hypothetical protein